MTTDRCTRNTSTTFYNFLQRAFDMTTDRCTRNTSTTFYNFLQGAFDMTTDRYEVTFDTNIIGGNTPIRDYVADLSSLESAEMTSDITNEINSPEYDKPHTPPHQIRSTSENQDLIKLNILYHENSCIKGNWPEAINRLVVSTDEAILVDRLKIKRDYKWDPVINNATNYIDELINNIQVHRGEEMSLASIERKNMTREDTEKKRSGHKIDILFRTSNEISRRRRQRTVHDSPGTPLIPYGRVDGFYNDTAHIRWTSSNFLHSDNNYSNR
ncbi:hypothetical protein GLOIN_2v1873974 [Rhizophagus irregularis DAOM 181602=DAOM 197198]|uniref:Uncharacterized protein n=1 Tax=Rhizophagus irregularis (strain DAOM 181602 / DAOM 197198 / MUCL 43194) TaxID=747089 RepID=A0A2P4Q8U9_RHIID|nr:hypothetical protein GLOIN_2v1873974 [Rhizophagus irregularis DAOM 181602=DAOM 197198]POG74056.1 hypothetical protein GLOIN_2v1873974 [Rhizophagus irregularis DAOM 181602=DAOM 197198]|eukprot:XP_025180922.1 hypothetical protein GLOIN_2v1873974 [Rhizophagus irregularis DAOM 181602=DAOM 197198]